MSNHLANTHLVRTAINQCNDGIRNISSRNIREAVVSFTASLRIIRGGMMEQHPGPAADASSSTMMPVGNPLDLCMDASLEDYNVQDACTADFSNNTSHTLFVYSQPIRPVESMLVSQTKLHGDGTMIPSVLSSITIFNLALAYQLSATAANHDDDSKSKQAKLRKSLRLYELVLMQLQDLLRSSSTSTLFTMVTLNNLGAIQIQMGQKEAAISTFQKLLFLSSNVMRSSYSLSDNSSSDDDDRRNIVIKNILKNATYIIFFLDNGLLEDKAAAPAA